MNKLNGKIASVAQSKENKEGVKKPHSNAAIKIKKEKRRTDDN